MGDETVGRCLVFTADAIGAHLFESHPALFSPILRHAPVRTPARAPVPSVTPVCFGTMFTGADPSVHGITEYEKKPLSCDTLFDAAARAGLRVSLVAVVDSSMDTIFRGRPVDHFSEAYDPEVTTRALELMRERDHDLIVTYQQEYDDVMHATDPWSDESLSALEHYAASFATLAEAAAQEWEEPYALVFATDHGTHLDPRTRRGAHGSDSSADVDVNLFWRLPSMDAE